MVFEGYFESVERLYVDNTLTFFDIRKPSDDEIRFSWGEDHYVKWDEMLTELLILMKRGIVHSFTPKGDVIRVALYTKFVEEIK